MEPESTFIGPLILIATLLTVIAIPVVGIIRRQYLERRQQREEEAQTAMFRYVTEQQRREEGETDCPRVEGNA